MAVSKIIWNGTALVDLTNDTVAENKLLSGYTATKNDGTEITGTIANGTITNNTSDSGTSSGTIQRGKKIKIGAGYYSNNLYYTAEANSGTLTIDTTYNAQTDIDVDGKSNVNITGINLTAPESGEKTFTVIVPKGENEDPLEVLFRVTSDNDVYLLASGDTDELVFITGVSF